MSTDPERVVFRVPVSEKVVTDALSRAAIGGGYAGWVKRLNKSSIRGIAERAAQSIMREGSAYEAAVHEAGAIAWRQSERHQQRATARRIIPRHSRALRVLTAPGPDEMQGAYEQHIFWRAPGSHRLIPDAQVRSLATAKEQSEWDRIRDAALARPRG